MDASTEETATGFVFFPLVPLQIYFVREHKKKDGLIELLPVDYISRGH